MIVKTQGSSTTCSRVSPREMAVISIAVDDPVPSDREAVEGAIRVRDVGEVGVEVAGGGRQLDRRCRLVADEVDHVEALCELQQRDVVVEVAPAATAHAVLHGRRAGDEPERDVFPPVRSAGSGLAG